MNAHKANNNLPNNVVHLQNTEYQYTGAGKHDPV